MVFEKFRGELREGLVAQLNNPQSEIAASLVRDCFGLLTLARENGRLVPEDLSLPNSYMHADILVASGFLERRGDTMNCTHYVITEKGREYNCV